MLAQSNRRNVYGILAIALSILVTGRTATAAESAANSFPASPFGEECRKWLDTFNSGDYTAMQALHSATDKEADRDRRALRDYQVYLVTRGVDPESIEQSAPNEITIAGRERLSGNLVNLVVRGSSVPPIHITEFGLRPRTGPASQAKATRLSEIDALMNFDQMLIRTSEADEFSGAALVAKDGNVLFKNAWGKANKATGAPNRTDTKFNLASAGKMFTAVAALQLMQTGKLSLDDTVGKHLPDYANKDVREKVTVRHLLTHTSGLDEMFNAKYEVEREHLRTVKDFVGLFETDPLKFEPGTRWSYSNAGFCLLGALIEKASGEDYYAYLDKHIFQPAGMTNTGAFETDKPAANMAIGYTREGAKTPEELRARKDNLAMHVVKGSPAGGSFSTVEDLARFANALTNHKLLDAEYLKMSMSPQAKTGIGNDATGLGFQIEPVNGHAIVGHRGGFPGISASFFMYPDDGYVVVVLCNYDSVAPVLALRMRDWIVSAPAEGGAAVR
jgi:CubicO group peptidase (beta-lactamase class C family)